MAVWATSGHSHRTALGMCPCGQMLNSPISVTNCPSKWHKQSSQQLKQSVHLTSEEVVPVLKMSVCAFRSWSKHIQNLCSLSFLTQLCCINLLGLGQSQDREVSLLYISHPWTLLQPFAFVCSLNDELSTKAEQQYHQKKKRESSVTTFYWCLHMIKINYEYLRCNKRCRKSWLSQFCPPGRMWGKKKR